MSETPATCRWRRIVAAHEDSGLTTRAFADENDLNPHTLAYWRSRLRRPAAAALPAPAFIEAQLVDPTPALGGLSLQLPRYGAVLQVAPDTDLRRLRAVLEALC